MFPTFVLNIILYLRMYLICFQYYMCITCILLLTYLFSIKFLYYSFSIFPLFILFVTISIQSYGNSLHIPTLYTLICKHVQQV
jgi:hypothetical protein